MILFHGCNKEAGHYWFGPHMVSGRGSGIFRRRHDDHWCDDPYHYVPWGVHVDGGLAPYGKLLHVEGEGAFAQAGRFVGMLEEDWWSAISWWDNSVDKRMASNITIVIDQRVGPDDLLTAARVKFAERFEVIKYEIKLPELRVIAI